MTEIPNRAEVEAELDEIDDEILFATVSGAHLYGFPSEDSDVDIRGTYIAPIKEVLALGDHPDTFDRITFRDGVEVDISFHEVEKFLELLLGRNAVVLEQLYSPLTVRTGDAHEELKELAADCITRHHAHHYLGFSSSRWEGFQESGKLKALLYAYRGLLTGLHLMETGRIEANLETLAEHHDAPELRDLIDRKRQGTEQMPAPEGPFAESDVFETWTERLEDAHAASDLPGDVPLAVRRRLSDFLVRLRLRLQDLAAVD